MTPAEKREAINFLRISLLHSMLEMSLEDPDLPTALQAREYLNALELEILLDGN